MFSKINQNDMKHLKFMLAVLLSLMTFGLSAQSTRTTWTTTATDLGEGLYEIKVTASIPEFRILTANSTSK